RAVLAVLVGASLAVSGAVMQGVFANPLAEPSIIGVSSGASVGAAQVIVLGIATIMPWTLPIAAFVTALVVTAVVWGLAHIGGRAGVLTLILTGIAVNAADSNGRRNTLISEECGGDCGLEQVDQRCARGASATVEI